MKIQINAAIFIDLQNYIFRVKAQNNEH